MCVYGGVFLPGEGSRERAPLQDAGPSLRSSSPSPCREEWGCEVQGWGGLPPEPVGNWEKAQLGGPLPVLEDGPCISRNCFDRDPCQRILSVSDLKLCF